MKTPFQVRDMNIDPPLVLAPMAGLTHLALRRVIRRYGRPGLFFTEMLSAASVPKENMRDSLFLMTEPEEHPIAFQIFAGTVNRAEAAVMRLRELGVKWIDLNMACPAPEIARKRKSGAFLLGDLETASRILDRIRTLFNGVLSVKIRLGWKADRTWLAELGSLLEVRVDAVALHPRMVQEKLKRKARWEYIGYLKRTVRIPVIGNGDIRCVEDATRMFAETGCDAVMIGRAAAEKPWIFRDIVGGCDWRPGPEDLLKAYRDVVNGIRSLFPDTKALGRIKEYTWYAAENMTFGHHFAGKIQGLKNMNRLDETIEREFRNSC